MEISEKNKVAIEEFMWDWQQTLLNQVGEPVSTKRFSAIRKMLEDIAAVAEGICERADKDEISGNVDQIRDLIWSRPGMPARYIIPSTWWTTPIGNLSLQAEIWAADDKLITLSQAAKICGKSLSALSQQIDRGRLTAYPDLNEPNPQRRMRVRWSEIQRMVNE
jgi:hypothetical protein